MQQIVIGDEGVIKLGFRNEGGFIDEHDGETQRPVRIGVSARHEDRLARARLDRVRSGARSLILRRRQRRHRANR
ncbi:hypothetical protein XF30_10745 [Bradyrhizobium sp. SUTN9-2]|nr:hypothetical protein XF30_10745 [Bradyrhizobium sp. SUTN9-2]